MPSKIIYENDAKPADKFRPRRKRPKNWKPGPFGKMADPDGTIIVGLDDDVVIAPDATVVKPATAQAKAG